MSLNTVNKHFKHLFYCASKTVCQRISLTFNSLAIDTTCCYNMNIRRKNATQLSKWEVFIVLMIVLLKFKRHGAGGKWLDTHIHEIPRSVLAVFCLFTKEA